MLGELENPIRPAWANHWITFKVNFSTRFADPHEAQKAIDKLMSGTLRQSTTARKFIDEVVDLCNKAGWNTEQQWMAMICRGINTDVARGMAAAYPANYDRFCARIIKVDKELYHLKKRDAPSKKATTSTKDEKKGLRPDNSKYKLTEEERKEHTEGNLCFRCHKKGHASKDCKSDRTVYAEYKKKKAQVTSTSSDAATSSKGKEKEIAKVEEVEDEEDFPKGD